MEFKKSYILGVAIVIGIVVGAIYFYNPNTTDNKDPLSGGVNPIWTPTIPDGWKSHSFEDYSLTFAAPEEAEVSTSPEGTIPESVRVYYMGEEQRNSGRTQTELADGYIITISKGEGPVLDLASKRHAEVASNCGEEASTTDVEESLIGSARALSFSVRNCRNDYDAHFVQMGNIPLEITVIYPAFSVEMAQAYKETTDLILSTFLEN